MAFKQEINVPLILTTGIVSVLLVMVLITGTEAWYKSEEQNEEAIKYEFPIAHAMRDQLREQQMEALAKTEWADANRDGVIIPIDEAMRVMVETNGKFPTTQPAGK